MTSSAPFEFRLGDRLRLRKRHPCGGWTWKVVRLGADIGLSCETCERRILLERSQVEHDVKTVLDRGPEAPGLPAQTAATSVEQLAMPQIGTVLKPMRPINVRIACYLTSTAEMSSGRLVESDRVRVAARSGGQSNEVSLELLESDLFERTYVPGGIRTHESYQGFAILIDGPVLAREFSLAEE